MTHADALPGRERFTGAEPAAARAELVQRLAAQHASVPALNRLTALAAQLLGVRAGQVSLIGAQDQDVMGGVGLALPSVGTTSPASESLCAVTVRAGRAVSVADAVNDVRVRDLPPVRTGVVGSYLGAPLVVDGHVVGALCVYDPEPREWSAQDVELIEQLAGPASAELELAALEALYGEDLVLWELAVGAAGIGVFDWRIDTGALRWDDRLLALFGLDRHSFGGTIEAFNATVHPDDRPRVAAALDEALRTLGSFSSEYRIARPDGSVRWVSARAEVIADADGVAVRLLGAAYDTTAVNEGETRVSRVLEAMPVGFCQLDRDWRFVYTNAAAERLLGAIGGPIVGQVMWELFPAAIGTRQEHHYRRAVSTGQPVELEAYYPAPLDRHLEIRAWPTPDGLALYFQDTSERHAARAAVRRADDHAALLAEVTRSLAEPLDLAESVSRLTRLVVPTLAGSCLVALAHGSRRPDAAQWRRRLRVAGWHQDEADPDPEAGIAPLDAGSAATVLSALVEHPDVVRAAEHDAWPVLLDAGVLGATGGPGSVVVLPLRGRGRTVGLLAVRATRGSDAFTPDELATLTDVAARAGLALGTVSALDEQRELAEGLQHSLLTAPYRPADLEVAVRYVPAAAAAQVGGDWYDAFAQPDGATVLVIGDVVGHDTAAAAVMGQVRSMLRGIAVATGEWPAGVLQAVDRAMDSLRVDSTASAVVARVEPAPPDPADPSGAVPTVLRWSNAGHPPPVVAVPCGPDAGTRVLWGPRSNMLLGIEPDHPRDEQVEVIAPGATVLLYTDGLIERRGEPLDVGLGRLSEALDELVRAGTGLEELCDALVQRLQTPEGDDDIALVAVRLRPDPAQP